MNAAGVYIMLITSYLLGGGSLIALAAFLYLGPLKFVSFGFNENSMLLFDAGISLLFFIQHSWMIRRTFRRSLERYLPEEYFSAFYAIASGIALLAVAVFWQGPARTLVTFQGISRLLLRFMLLASVVGFFWGAQALKYFDPFGIRQVINHLRGRKPRHMPFTVRGPYRWVRHPLYVFVIVLIWSSPDLTMDRLLFNVLWTIWIVVGAFFEERDLVADFGGEYIEYQQRVPMLIPYKRPVKANHSFDS